MRMYDDPTGAAPGDIPGPAPPQRPPAAPPPEGGLPPIDIPQALERLEGDRELLDEVMQAFLGTIPELLGELRQACAEGDAARMRAAAHSLKGSAANISAEPTREVAGRLEKIAASGDLHPAEAALEELQGHLDRVKEFAGR